MNGKFGKYEIFFYMHLVNRNIMIICIVNKVYEFIFYFILKLKFVNLRYYENN